MEEEKQNSQYVGEVKQSLSKLFQILQNPQAGELIDFLLNLVRSGLFVVANFFPVLGWVGDSCFMLEGDSDYGEVLEDLKKLNQTLHSMQLTSHQESLRSKWRDARRTLMDCLDPLHLSIKYYINCLKSLHNPSHVHNWSEYLIKNSSKACEAFTKLLGLLAREPSDLHDDILKVYYEFTGGHRGQLEIFSEQLIFVLSKGFSVCCVALTLSKDYQWCEEYVEKMEWKKKIKKCFQVFEEWLRRSMEDFEKNMERDAEEWMMSKEISDKDLVTKLQKHFDKKYPWVESYLVLCRHKSEEKDTKGGKIERRENFEEERKKETEVLEKKNIKSYKSFFPPISAYDLVDGSGEEKNNNYEVESGDEVDEIGEKEKEGWSSDDCIVENNFLMVERSVELLGTTNPQNPLISPFIKSKEINNSNNKNMSNSLSPLYSSHLTSDLNSTTDLTFNSSPEDSTDGNCLNFLKKKDTKTLYIFVRKNKNFIKNKNNYNYNQTNKNDNKFNTNQFDKKLERKNYMEINSNYNNKNENKNNYNDNFSENNNKFLKNDRNNILKQKKNIISSKTFLKLDDFIMKIMKKKKKTNK